MILATRVLLVLLLFGTGLGAQKTGLTVSCAPPAPAKCSGLKEKLIKRWPEASKKIGGGEWVLKIEMGTEVYNITFSGKIWLSEVTSADFNLSGGSYRFPMIDHENVANMVFNRMLFIRNAIHSIAPPLPKSASKTG